jgi:ribose transport system substrate-binding protein
MEAGIPVVILDRVFDSQQAARSWIGGDNYCMGAADGGADVVRSAGDPDLVAVLVEGEPELGGDDGILADRLQCLAH